ncbi:hemerythrin domain-containing protein [Rhizobium mongolense]|uniref:Iron-sulfur cluster repair protein YtfE (RIC family) n=1 Tax=Rhizobium mongolense TaxID=57676 RepID=A0A7W6WIX4_9HYPH|nr:hemerythrin domain-containing protein [Rhizobium mongolense]MBB4279263.1 iron-sulfur cluster repair protein YtfE (RIC family) [Rhizobium mongolense]
MNMMPKTGDFAELEENYRELLSWCGVLEAVADFLPCRIDQQVCERICSRLLPVLEATQALEERLVFPRMESCLGYENAAVAIARRRDDHHRDQSAAEEVVLTLGELKAGGSRLSWDAIGYMLRSFFCCMRRHIIAEQEVLRMLKNAKLAR